MERREVDLATGRSPGWGLLYRLLLGRIGRRKDRLDTVKYILDAQELPGSDWRDSRQGILPGVWSPRRERGLYLRSVSASRNYRFGAPPPLPPPRGSCNAERFRRA